MEVATTQPVTLPLTLTDSSGNPINIVVRKDDGYIDGSHLCQQFGKLWKNYYRGANTLEFLAILAEHEGVSIENIVAQKRTATTADEPRAKCLVELGKNRFQHTWLVRIQS